MGRAGVEARARKGASHPKRAKRLVAPKRNLGTVSPRPRLLFATFPRTNRQSKGWTRTASKKRKHRSLQTQKMKKPRTGGSGASRVPWGGTSDGVGECHHTIRLRLLPALCVRHFVSQAALSLSVAMFHYYDRSDPSETGAKSLTART